MKSLLSPCLAFPALLALTILPASALVVPYSNDFSGIGSNTSFVNPAGTWNLSGGAYSTTIGTGTNVISSAAQTFTNLDGVSFTMTTRFSVSSVATLPGNQSFTLGFGAFANNAGFTGNYYLADFAYTGQGTANPAKGTLRILAIGDTTDFAGTTGSAIDSAATGNLAITSDSVYTLTLTGTYTGPSLDFSLALYNNLGVQIGSTATGTDSTPLSGDFFGYRNRDSGNVSSGSTVINYDNFGIALVPEPHAGLPILAALSLGLLLRRRR